MNSACGDSICTDYMCCIACMCCKNLQAVEFRSLLHYTFCLWYDIMRKNAEVLTMKKRMMLLVVELQLLVYFLFVL